MLHCVGKGVMHGGRKSGKKKTHRATEGYEREEKREGREKGGVWQDV